uniref:Uncharacterized protein n=1 Tax=Hucho hucho TaxID=62062 RepID=A0A4W5MVK1_9TELE
MTRCVYRCNTLFSVQDNSAWGSGMDEQIMHWATSRPEDWHLGGKCDVFLWGAGRHGQLAEAGRNILVPTTAPSFSQAQQVERHNQSIKCIYKALLTSADVTECCTETQPKTPNSKQCRCRSTVARKYSLERTEPRKKHKRGTRL